MKDRRQIAHEAAYRAQSEGQSINGIAEAVMQLVLEKIALAWQPIETAPKDGEDMILLLEDESWLIGYWHEGAQTWDTSAGWAEAGSRDALDAPGSASAELRRRLGRRRNEHDMTRAALVQRAGRPAAYTIFLPFSETAWS